MAWRLAPSFVLSVSLRSIPYRSALTIFTSLFFFHCYCCHGGPYHLGKNCRGDRGTGGFKYTVFVFKSHWSVLVLVLALVLLETVMALGFRSASM